MEKYRMPIREQESNKGTFGKVLNFCGCENYIGASYLATVSSLKVGAGFSALASTKDVIRSVSSLLPEAVYLSREEGLKSINNYTVVLIGCGIGISQESQSLLQSVLTKIDKRIPLVIDADGLNILSESSIKPSSNTILTPHPLEAARLLGVDLEIIVRDVESAVKQLYEKYGCTIVLKTHRTVIYDGERLAVNQHGNSALAKAGSGDVLAGVISGLLAQKMPLFEAAKLGVYLHSRAGEIASEELTEYAVLASDLPKYIHKAIKEIL